MLQKKLIRGRDREELVASVPVCVPLGGKFTEGSLEKTAVDIGLRGMSPWASGRERPRQQGWVTMALGWGRSAGRKWSRIGGLETRVRTGEREADCWRPSLWVTMKSLHLTLGKAGDLDGNKKSDMSLSPLYSWGNQGTEKSCNLLKAIRGWGGGSWLSNPAVWF